MKPVVLAVALALASSAAVAQDKPAAPLAKPAATTVPAKPAAATAVAPKAIPLAAPKPLVKENPMQTTASGLQYIDTVVGTGDAPVTGKRVTVHYTGWLQSNKQKFDSSVDRGKPFSFAIGIGQVIKGWDEGVLSMKVGGKRQLIIPANLGYGARGAGGVIPPNATLVFDVELLSVEK
jgi:peptidylprolyl isomerase